MKQIIYEVHSDVNENNVFLCFEGKGSKQKAIAYAKRNKADETWVDKVEFNTITEEYDYLGAVWVYNEDED